MNAITYSPASLDHLSLALERQRDGRVGRVDLAGQPVAGEDRVRRQPQPGLMRQIHCAEQVTLAGAPASKNTRRVFLRDFPFAVVYRPDADGITIFALAHHSRRPGYWQSRVQDR